ncbi:AAA family ATPase [Kibdelosporangium persicum]|uniref:ABC-type polar amino acid transport system, ATPase component n=1 Tax=Kibdelosporangium persicum TaxID=2698649 RepID=A0ABX2F441_9PSEU|nr:AAA family ATPase [Kibdelosporangium persicum]NRN66101.1 ABC-type polar amino acid transport system, ATPase component [Kibdelosporangium persicum]
MDITVESRALVVVAGLPGSGKSTLLRRTQANVPICVLDTDHMRSLLARLLPRSVPYGWYRPLVHLLHTARVLVTVLCSPRPVLLHDPATGAGTRTAFAVIGAITRRHRHFIWIDCTPAEALAGQVARGRVLLKWSFARHMRRSPEVRSRLLAGLRPQGWHTAQLVDRHAASTGLHLKVA